MTYSDSMATRFGKRRTIYHRPSRPRLPIPTPRRSRLQSEQPEELLLLHCNGWWATHEFLVIRR